ncbi:polysaccharide biosynthesis protein [Pedobacter sp. HMF7647]|uniref:Polysaccharide biosynthesis protein n=1 Tax=Hufsiella arboris TaxID=2695275 RepID=A0A7K1YBC0_9SPHI|nr:polysaccharide biosynthesis protein [Hufsiella arboris]MXV51661.1 polysaccharide biosynthesis protein [Hufsiella arboris]
MGIIIKQTIKGTIYSYLGILIGFITTSIIQPHALDPSEVGLLGLLTSGTLLFAQFSILGFNGTARYFPYFRNEEKKHHGYLFLACVISLIGMILFTILAFVFKDQLIGYGAEKSKLLVKYYWYIIPLTFFTLFFNVFDLYARLLYNITTGLILKEFVKRIFILIAFLLIYFNLIGFGSFMVMWLIANIFPIIFMVSRLIKDNQFHFKPDFQFLDRTISSKLLTICFFTILTGAAPLIIQNIDTYYIYKKIGLSAAGIYSIAFFFATVISLPSRSLYSIAYTVIAESWKSNDMQNIITVYRKSCINQLLSALFIFIIIWANVGNIFKLLPPEYKDGEYVIFFVSLGFLIDSATGVNGVILATSKYFKYDSLFNFLLVGITIGANLWLIPIYGLNGGALASTLTFLIFNLFRFIFIWIAFKMQPFNYKSLLILVLGVIIYFISEWIIPVISNFIADGIVRSLFITFAFGLGTYYLNLSEDVNVLINKYLPVLKVKR